MIADAYIGWDIGGAHLKIAQINAVGEIVLTRQLATPLWQGLHHLEQAIVEIQQQINAKSALYAISMTAELVDIFPDRQSGVRQIIQLIKKYLTGEVLYVYAGTAGLVALEKSSAYLQEIASANWHATASYVANQCNEGILIDIGSTTTDIIPFASGKPRVHAYTDHERIRKQELIYTGVIRTPIMAIVENVPFNKQWQTIIAEHFATMADVYRLTGELMEADDMMETADRNPKTLHDSARRLGRMLGIDIDTVGFDINCYRQVASYIADVQLRKISLALQQLLARTDMPTVSTLVGAGIGCFIVKKIAILHGLNYIAFANLVQSNATHDASGRATAISLAQLVRGM